MALSFQSPTETLMGHPDAPATIKRAMREPQDPRVACHHNGAGAARFRWLIMSDQLPEARPTITALLREVRRRGMVESEVHFLRVLAETELRSGHCGRALDLARESLRLARDSGSARAPPRCSPPSPRPRAATSDRRWRWRGRLRGAPRRTATRCTSRAPWPPWARPVRGRRRGGRGRSLRRVRELEQGLGITDPARGRWQGDLAEALVRVGEPGEAQDVIDRHARTRAAAGPGERAGRAGPGGGPRTGGARRTRGGAGPG